MDQDHACNSRCECILDLAILYCFSFSLTKDLAVFQSSLVEITAFSVYRMFDLVPTSKKLFDLGSCEIAYPIMLRGLLFQHLKMADSSLNTEIVIPKRY